MSKNKPKSAREFAVAIYFNDPDINVLEEMIAERDEQIRLWERAKGRYDVVIEKNRQGRRAPWDRILSRFSE